jgi:hypothetical protein
MFESWVKTLSTGGIRKGLTGSTGWLVVGIIAVGIRAIQRMAHEDDAVLYRTAIKAGDVFEVITRPPQ